MSTATISVGAAGPADDAPALPGACESETLGCLDAIDRLNPALNAILTVTGEAALDRARALDRERAAGEWPGLLDGVPVTIKDCFELAGETTSYGSVRFAAEGRHDAAVVRRLKASGAVLVGRNNLSEFCLGSTNQNEHHGSCRNPWNTTHVPGGSSGGSASAVAAGLCRVSIGTDTGGSIRIPAALCGVVGLRPSVGRVPNTGVIACSVDFDTVGPLACSVSDVARAFAAIAGYDPEDPNSVDAPLGNFLPALRDGIAGVRIGLPRNFYFDGLQPAVAERLREAAAVLERVGATLVDVTVEDAEVAQARTGFSLLVADMAQYHLDKIEAAPEAIGPEVLRRLKLGLPVSGVAYAESRRWLAGWKLRFRALFERVDLILTPTTPIVAPAIADAADMIEATKAVSRFTYGFGALGLPAMTVPCGFGAHGLPVGMQIVGRWFDEPLVLRAGAAFQAATDHHRQRPRLG
ncbi:amidase [Azospirillum doebereinerae]|uniref:amidase n=1 Tax=Azospirillum doebereinerae TaxID=92933 RepID=UPI001FD537DE|nr:amidase [Azospirillum doebereinerae]